MGKKGPCFHCGIDRTPLWRNGPPEKPVLCNACGSRYRLRGTLDNYNPKHLQARLPSQKNNKHKRPKTNTGLINTISSAKFQQACLKTDNNFCAVASATGSHHGADDSDKSISVDQSTTSVSSYPDNNSKSNGSQLRGQINGGIWDFHVPKRKRSLVTYRSFTPVEQLQRELYSILVYEEPNILHESEEDVLLYTTNNQIAPNEIGLGCMLLKSE